MKMVNSGRRQVSLRGLLAWYEYKHDEKVLTAIERAVEDVMTHYPVDNSHPFYSKKPDVGRDLARTNDYGCV